MNEWVVFVDKNQVVQVAPPPVRELVSVDEVGLVAVLDDDPSLVVEQLKTEQVTTGGTQGPPGPPGVPGAAGSYFMHQQSVASVVWDVTHNLNKNPAVTVLDTAGTEVTTRVEHMTPQRVLIYFAQPQTGSAHFS